MISLDDNHLFHNDEQFKLSTENIFFNLQKKQKNSGMIKHDLRSQLELLKSIIKKDLNNPDPRDYLGLPEDNNREADGLKNKIKNFYR